MGLPFVAASLLAPVALSAQDLGLSELLPGLFVPDASGQLPGFFVLGETGHGNHFAQPQPEAAAAMALLNRGLATQLATLPLGSSSGGFSYTFDRGVGIFSRSSESFGPLFAERALTAGKGKLTVGATYLRFKFDSLDGKSLEEGGYSFFIKHVELGQPGDVLNNPFLFFEGDLIRADLFLSTTAETTTVFANYGVTDRLDVGLAIPYVRLSMDVRLHLHIDRLSTGSSPFLFHVFPNGGEDADLRRSGSAHGFGDLVLRAKYQLKSVKSGGLALAADLRLPTGDERNLLGSGATQAKLFFIASGPNTRFSPHVNVGYTFSTGAGLPTTGSPPQEINYTAGLDAAVRPRITVTADLLGRTLRNSDRLVATIEEYRYKNGREGFGGDGRILTTELPKFEVVKGSLNLVSGAVGLKVNPFGSLLVSANVLLPLAQRGLHYRPAPVISVDYSF